MFVVTSDYTGKGMMELSLSKGTLVGVVKDRDPMGNKDRWFVDNGGALLTRQASSKYSV